MKMCKSYTLSNYQKYNKVLLTVVPKLYFINRCFRSNVIPFRFYLWKSHTSHLLLISLYLQVTSLDGQLGCMEWSLKN